MKQVLRSRKEFTHERHQQFRLPQVILGAQLSESQTVESEAAVGDLKGIGVSSGTAEGRVRVLHSIDEIATVLKGEIVVVPSLDPTWTIVYARAAGLVAQRGAILSHGAILAREFRLPAIANVPEAPSCLRDGQRVKINGTTGHIQIFRRVPDHDAPYCTGRTASGRDIQE